MKGVLGVGVGFMVDDALENERGRRCDSVCLLQILMGNNDVEAERVNRPYMSCFEVILQCCAVIT